MSPEVPSGRVSSDLSRGPEGLGQATVLFSRTKGAGVPGDSLDDSFIHSMYIEHVQ